MDAIRAARKRFKGGDTFRSRLRHIEHLKPMNLIASASRQAALDRMDRGAPSHPLSGVGPLRGTLMVIAVMLVTILALPHGDKLPLPGAADSSRERLAASAPGTVKIAEARSVDRQYLHWASGRGVAASVVLATRPDLGPFVQFVLDAGAIRCAPAQVCSIMLRFDDRAPVKFKAVVPADGNVHKLVMLDNARLVGMLRKSRRLSVQVPLLDDGDRAWSFNVAGLTHGV